MVTMGNEQSPEEINQILDAKLAQLNSHDDPIPILQESNVKSFGKRWKTDHDTFEIGTLTLCTNGTIVFVNSKTNTETSISKSVLTSIGECTIAIEYPVTLLIISYKQLKQPQNKTINIDAAFLVPQYQTWLDVLRHLTSLVPQTHIYTPECPICLMENDPYIYLVNCNHIICRECLFNYIKSQIKDASKYPMKCFNFKCDVMLHMSDVQFAFSGLPDAEAPKQENADDDDDHKDEEKEVPQAVEIEIQCICGKAMDRIYINPYDDQNVLCDICVMQIQDDTDFYHCTMEKEQQHPYGYDLCIECADARQQTQTLKDTQLPICACGDVLKPIMPRKCYGSSNGVVCDECRQTFKNVIVWHCAKTFVKPHLHGYDLCIECGNKHTLEYLQKQQDELHEEPIDLDAINNNQKPQINYADPTTKQDFTAIYGKFSVLCAMAESERDQCPKCEMVFFGEPRLKAAVHRAFIPVNEAQFCANKRCNYKFKVMFANKLKCILCGEIFCEKCRNYHLELSKGSHEAQLKYIASEKVKKHKSNLSLFDQIGGEFNKIFKSEQELKDMELELEQKELQRTTSDEKKEIISGTIIDCCHVCWLQFYRGLCSECNYEYCLECRQKWHPNVDCVEEKRQKETKEKQQVQNDELNQTFFKERGFVKCPRCGVMIEKTDGCNAIPHKCKTKDETEYTNIYVCHCCGEYLKDHDHERDGTNHFPDGPFAICRV
eukprot:576860_1